MENAAQKVVRLLGGVTKAAIVAQVNPKSVYLWMDKGIITQPQAARRLALACSEVTLEELLFGLNGGPNGGGVKSTATSCNDTPLVSEVDAPGSPLAAATACAA